MNGKVARKLRILACEYAVRASQSKWSVRNLYRQFKKSYHTGFDAFDALAVRFKENEASKWYKPLKKGRHETAKAKKKIRWARKRARRKVRKNKSDDWHGEGMIYD